MANDAVKPQTSTAMGSEPTFTFMDLLALSACSDILCHDVEMTEQQMSQLRTQDEKSKLHIKPFIDVIDMNNSDDDPYANKPKPAVVIGIKGEF